MIKKSSTFTLTKVCHRFAFYVSYDLRTTPTGDIYGRSSYVKQKDPANTLESALPLLLT